MPDILEQIKRRRKELGLTQSDMMMCIGMSRQQYQRLESRGNPRLENLELLAKGLKMELMLIPAEKLQAIKSILAHEETIVENTLADNPWKGLLNDPADDQD